MLIWSHSCLSLPHIEFFLQGDKRIWASLSPGTKWAVSIKRQWIWVPSQVRDCRFKPQYEVWLSLSPNQGVWFQLCISFGKNWKVARIYVETAGGGYDNNLILFLPSWEDGLLPTTDIPNSIIITAKPFSLLRPLSINTAWEIKYLAFPASLEAGGGSMTQFWPVR